MKMLNDFLSYDAAHHQGYASQFWPKLISMAYPVLAHMPLLEQLSHLVNWFYCNTENAGIQGKSKMFGSVEYAAGKGNLTRGMISRGFVSCALDIIFSDQQDCLTSHGLRLWIEVLLHCSSSSASLWFGTQCSSFVPLCISVSKRCSDNNFFGDVSKEFVQQGNALMMITSFIMALGLSMGHYATLEQPLGSCMPSHPIMMAVIKFFHMKKYVTYLGAFGARTVKPIQLLSTISLESCEMENPIICDETLASRGPNGEYTGKKESLVESEHYPLAFGKAVAKAYDQMRF